MFMQVGVVLAVLLAAVEPARANVTVFLDREGFVTDDGIDIPAFGGGDQTWHAMVGCVQRQYAPFAIDFVDERPTEGKYITAVVGGLASQLGLDDDVVNGVGPFDGSVERDAVVYIFSQVGTGERDVENLCAVTAHEVGHALGLEHELLCGDVMSYYLDRCGARTFMKEAGPCGETAVRRCSNGARTQSSYQRLAELVGFREDAATEPVPDVDRTLDEPSPVDDSAPVPPAPRHDRHHGRHHQRAWRCAD